MRVNRASTPEFRYLRAYAFDPSLSLQIDTAKINRLTYRIAWEELTAGPCGEYLEIIDRDPTIDVHYTPVDLDDKHILARNGLRPSVSNPQFHQQMVYAVAMVTIQNFEKALGRKVIWSGRRTDNDEHEVYVKRLRIYPHAMREANAYYSPYRKALLFGYFSSTPANNVMHMPNSLVFTCLSHDIIAHEVTHAILDGIHPNFNNPTNPDMLAFHEAFADIVALFQHFTHPEVLKFEIANTRGDLGSQNLLGKLAQELGSAIGGYGSLRDAIGSIDQETGEWKPKKPDPADYANETSPHRRGSILVSAIFEAFLTIYGSRIADLLRIATNGTGILNQGELHPDLVNRLAGEAAKSAKHVLGMCIRALDYCPPVDLTFGDYLRAIITADMDILKNDPKDYRLAFIDAFRKRGIYPQDLKTLSIETLSYPPIDLKVQANNEQVPFMGNIESSLAADETFPHFIKIITGFLQEYAQEIQYITDREKIYDITKSYIAGNWYSGQNQKGLHFKIQQKFRHSRMFSRLTGMAFVPDYQELGFRPSVNGDFASFEIEKLRVVSRVGPDDQQINHVVFSIIQRSGARLGPDGEIEHFIPTGEPLTDPDDFIFYGGCTLIFDLESKQLRYAITKPLLDLDALESDVDSKAKINEERLRAQHRYQNHDMSLYMGEARRYFGTRASDFLFTEPFAILHQH